MQVRDISRATVSLLLIAALASPSLFAAAPAGPSAGPASLEGSIVIGAPGAEGGGLRPVSGAVVRAADLVSGAIHDSAASGEKGEFRIASLPPGSYSVAVQTSEGLFLTDQVVTLAAGQPGRVSFSLRARADAEEEEGTSGDKTAASEDAAAPSKAAPPANRKYDCSSRKEDSALSDAQRREKRQICGWWATTNGWAKFGIIAGSAALFGVTAAAIANDAGNDKDKEHNPSPSAP
jgi:hypothetical protein